MVAIVEARGGGGTPIWNRQGSSEILNLTLKGDQGDQGDHLGVAQAFWDS